MFPGLQAAEWDLMKQALLLWLCPLWQLQLPGAWLWGKQSRQSLLPGPPALRSPGGPLLHSQPHPTHVKLMSSRAHTRAALTVLTYLIKTAAFKYGGSAPGRRGALGCLWPVWTLATPPPCLSSLPPSSSLLIFPTSVSRKEEKPCLDWPPSTRQFSLLSNVLSKVESVT